MVAGRRRQRLGRYMRTERFDPASDTVAVRACHEIYLAAARADGVRRPVMSPRTFQAWLRYGWTEDPSEAWLARDDDGDVCGWYLLSLPERENRHLADVNLVVTPLRRRNGLGTALLDHGAGRARQAGRPAAGRSGLAVLQPRRPGAADRGAGGDNPARGRPARRELGF